VEVTQSVKVIEVTFYSFRVCVIPCIVYVYMFTANVTTPPIE